MLIKSIKNDGVSPVIAVILMVAVTVILSAVIGSFVLDVGGSISANPQAGVTFSTVGGTVTVQAVSMDGADSLTVKAPDGTEKTINNVGESVEINASSGESITVIGERDGKEAVIQSFTKDATTASGGGGGGGGDGGGDGGGVSGPFSSPSTSAPGDISTVAFDGGDGTEANPYVIMNDQQLQAMNNDLGAHYILGQNIDASGTTSWNGGDGFDPIGEGQFPEFTGSLDGDGYVVDGLHINRPSENEVGLIGANNGDVSNIGVVNADVTGGDYSVGGLVGLNHDGTVTESYSTASVSGADSVGGLVGYNDGGTLSDSYATGEVSGTDNYVGGLVGFNTGTVSESYATGEVSGDVFSIGGLVGSNTDTVSNSYWDVDSSGQSSSSGGTGLTTSDMQGDSYDAGFESEIVDNAAFTGITGDYPELAWQSE